MRRVLVGSLLCAALVFAATADAARVYRWKDRSGAVRYGDQAPAAETVPAREVRVVPVPVEPGRVVRLRIDGSGPAGTHEAWADNQLAGTVEVRLSFARSRNVGGEPALPARATVPAYDSALIARIATLDPARAGDFELRLEAVPGNPNAKPRDVEYLFPLLMASVRVEQGYGGSYSHDDDQNRYAVDFAAPIGTAVVAARDGTVMQVENDFDQAGLDREQLGGRANFVRIVHDDGTMGVYAHLREGGVMVRVGQRVRTGQLIGHSGNTGYTSGPHLHFALQVNRGMRLVSIPFRMHGPGGILRFGEPR